MPEAPKVLERMMEMWNERDLETVRGHIEAIFSEEVIFIDPSNSIVGHDAFEAMVREFRKRFPEADLSHSSGFDEHHGLVRYHWEIHQDGQFLIEGFDVAEIGSDGRVSRVEGFFGPMPGK